MNCPVCQRSLAPTLSICPTCGAMMNDTVREEVEKNITSGPLPIERKPQPAASAVRPPVAAYVNNAPRPATRVHTSGLAAPKTSPTLVEFGHKNKSVPEWRLQLQNAVQQRRGQQETLGEKAPLAMAEALPQKKPSPSPVTEMPETIADPRVANAIRRITESRNTFLETPAEPKRTSAARNIPQRPFGVVKSSPGSSSAVLERPIAPVAAKPHLVPLSSPQVSPPTEFKRDTNKLPRIELGQPISEAHADTSPEQFTEAPVEGVPESRRIQIPAEEVHASDTGSVAEEIEEIEDLAPLSMRFGAGLFDFIIGGFSSMLLLSPFVFAGMEWLTAGGLLTLAGTFAIVLFLYMTASLGFFGKTVGMKLFSLELVDAVGNEYPTIRQAAVNSSIFLLSIGVAGAGFLTMLFNEEKRALHDLMSGTILVREF